MMAGALLAAGQGSRFGADKRQARLPDGRTLLEASAAAFIGRLEPLALVLPEDDAFGLELCGRLGLQPLACRLNRGGIGHSLACAAAWALGLPDAGAWCWVSPTCRRCGRIPSARWPRRWRTAGWCCRATKASQAIRADCRRIACLDCSTCGAMPARGTSWTGARR
ncbi:MobA-like NTP transferase domain [Chromobacterium violaceum]|uniref:MobA-like NTP transferase domain n=1 Tax=Chromobacterium violaceum TaxID=536 RepID=A0A447TAL8_CHRVL|nr:MobA-like NTP transferase domain [Chromobacterium violaceum]